MFTHLERLEITIVSVLHLEAIASTCCHVRVLELTLDHFDFGDGASHLHRNSVRFPSVRVLGLDFRYRFGAVELSLLSLFPNLLECSLSGLPPRKGIGGYGFSKCLAESLPTSVKYLSLYWSKCHVWEFSPVLKSLQLTTLRVFFEDELDCPEFPFPEGNTEHFVAAVPDKTFIDGKQCCSTVCWKIFLTEGGYIDKTRG